MHARRSDVPGTECPHPGCCSCPDLGVDFAIDVHAVDLGGDTAIAVVSVNGGAQWTIPLYTDGRGAWFCADSAALMAGVPRGVVAEAMSGDCERQIAALLAMRPAMRRAA